jgi:hypothetical protein
VPACTKIDLYSSDVFTQYNYKNTTSSTTRVGACMLSVIMLIFEIKTVMLSVVIEGIIMLISVNYSQKKVLCIGQRWAVQCLGAKILTNSLELSESQQKDKKR